MDLTTILGIVLGVALLGGAVVVGGNAAIFVNMQSVMIVLGGTLAGTMVSYKLKTLLKIPALFKIAFTEEVLDTRDIIQKMVMLAQKARREGLLALEQDVRDINNPFLQKGVELVIDGTDPEMVKAIMKTKLQALEERHQVGRSLFNTMGQLSPAFGMIGTLIGLIQMLSRLNDPSNLGSGMAVALITTLYGSLLANLLFIPMSNKLKERNEDEVLFKELIIRGILSIQDGENPRIIEEKLSAYLEKEKKAGVEEPEVESTVVRENA